MVTSLLGTLLLTVLVVFAIFLVHSIYTDYFRQWRCKRARQYLLKHDLAFRHREASLELISRRNAFHAAGGDPASPECPNRE